MRDLSPWRTFADCKSLYSYSADDISAGTDKQIQALSKKHHLNAKETNILHREVSHQGYGYWEIDELIYDLFGK